jgi:glutamate racemase
VRPIVDEITAWGADTLVLGCTHYPLLRPALARVAGGALTIVDSAETTATRVERILAVNRLEGSGDQGSLDVFVTAAPHTFQETAALLFGEQLPEPELVPLWDGDGVQAVAS